MLAGLALAAIIAGKPLLPRPAAPPEIRQEEPAPVPDAPPPAAPDTPDPVPVEPDPEPVEPDPPEPELVVYEKTFVDDLGNGGYGYSTTFAQAWGGDLPWGKLTFSSSNPEVVSVNSLGIFTTLAPGTAVISAVDISQPDSVLQYDLTITVEDSFRWKYKLPDTSVECGNTCVNSISISQWSTIGEYTIELAASEWTSNDKSIAEVTPIPNLSGCEIHWIAPGTATIYGKLTFAVFTADGPKMMDDNLSFQVTVEAPEAPVEPEIPEAADPVVEQKELKKFGSASGYGFNGRFELEWGDFSLLGKLTDCTSSDSSVIDMAEDGSFTTLSEGTATLSAKRLDDPGHQYVMTLHVQNHLDWDREISDVVIQAGRGWFYGPSSTQQPCGMDFVSCSWESSNPDVAAVRNDSIWCNCWATGAAPGEAVITGVYVFDVKFTTKGVLRMTDTVTFQVAVTEPE